MRIPHPLRSLTAIALLGAAGCYHAVVETGRQPAPTVVEKPWVNTFVFGLVPAPVIDVSAQCPGGIAKVETQQTFLNGLVGALTLGIYTPQSATITCAVPRTGALPTPPSMQVVATSDSPAARAAAVQAALRRSAATRSPVLVQF